MSGETALNVCGETLLLHPERAVIWPERRMVIVADIHFGKSGVLRRHGLAVPAGADDVDRRRLSELIARWGLTRLLVLGDFFHAPLSEDEEDAQALQRWSDSLRDIRVQVIAGNHDRGTSSGWRGSLEWIGHEYAESPFRFVHEARNEDPGQKAFSFSGHIHPVVAMRGLRKRAARVPVFWLRPHGLVLPSFGVFTGGYRIVPAPGEKVFAVSPEQVVPFPTR